LKIQQGLAKANAEKGNYDVAEQMYEKCLETINYEPQRYRKDLLKVLMELGDVYQRKGLQNDALAIYYNGLQEVQDDEIPIKAEFLVKIAKIYIEKGEEVEAERCLGLAM